MSTKKFSSALVLINGRSGWKSAHHLFSQSLQTVLDQEGVVHELVKIPPKETGLELSRREPTDLVVVCGGDGTVSSVASQLAVRPSWHRTAVLAVPCGVQNSIAHALRIHSPEDALLAYSGQQTLRSSNWEVVLRDEEDNVVSAPVRGTPDVDNKLTAIAHLSGGIFTDVSRDARQLQLWTAQMMSLPQVKHRYTWCFLYQLFLRFTAFSCAMTITFASGETREIKERLRMFHFSHVPLQHSGFCVTPYASLEAQTIEGVIVTEAADRSRVLHLFFREAQERQVMEEDGVFCFHNIASVKLTPNETLHFSVDGETYVCEGGSSLTLQRSDVETAFLRKVLT